MQLFTRREVTLESEKKKANDITQVAYLTTTLARLQKQINDEVIEFDKRMEEQRNVYSEVKEALKQEIKTLTDDLQRLKTARSEALVPIGAIERRAEALRAKAQTELEVLEKKQEQAEELINTLTERLDSLSERECILQAGEDALMKKIEGAQAERLIVSEGHKKLNEMVAEFRATFADKNTSLAIREKEIIAREIAFKTIIEEKQKQLDSKEKELVNRERAVRDRYETLLRSISRET